jgi:hypothetical protein
MEAEIEEAERTGHSRDHEIMPLLVHGMLIGAFVGALVGAILLVAVVTASEPFHPWLIVAGGLSGVSFGVFFGGFIAVTTRLGRLFDD